MYIFIKNGDGRFMELLRFPLHQGVIKGLAIYAKKYEMH